MDLPNLPTVVGFDGAGSSGQATTNAQVDPGSDSEATAFAFVLQSTRTSEEEIASGKRPHSPEQDVDVPKRARHSRTGSKSTRIGTADSRVSPPRETNVALY